MPALAMNTATLNAGINAPLDFRRARPLWVARLSGTQVQMGRQHARLLRDVGGWEHMLAYYSRMPEFVLGGPRTGEGPPAMAQALKPLVALALRSLEGRRPRELRARSRVFFQEMGMPESNSRHAMVMDVMQNVINLAGRFGLGPSRALTSRAVPACTSLVAWGRASDTGQLLHARNFDFPGVGVWERNPAVVFCEPSDGGLRYGFVAPRGADVCGVSTFNEAGISVTSHTRFHRDARMFSGMGIVDLCHEITRHARTLQDAVRIARRRPVSSTWGLTVSSASERRAIVIETTGLAVEVVEPLEGEDFLAHTNRYSTPSLQARQVAPTAAFMQNSDGRLRVGRSWGKRGGLSVADLQEFLGTDEDPDVPGGTRVGGGTISQPLTVHSVVIQPEAEAVHVAVGPVPTGQGPYVTVPWRWAREPEAEVLEAPAGFTLPSTPKGQAHESFLESARLQGSGATHLEVEDALIRAADHAPENPTYRYLAGAYALRRNDFPAARRHLEAGLAEERAPFHRGQILLWASRAAAAEGDRDEASKLRRELLSLDEPLVKDFQAEARRDDRRPYSAARMRRLEVHPGMPSAFVP
jgi:hypothetical protein